MARSVQNGNAGRKGKINEEAGTIAAEWGRKYIVVDHTVQIVLQSSGINGYKEYRAWEQE